jgi:hypothetical protein
MRLISWLKLAAMTAPATTVAQLDGSDHRRDRWPHNAEFHTVHEPNSDRIARGVVRRRDRLVGWVDCRCSNRRVDFRVGGGDL